MHQRDAAGQTLEEAVPPAFSTVTLTIPLEDATRLARMQVEDLAATETEAGTELRTPGGDLVAVAASRRLRDGSVGTDLAYLEASAASPGARTAEQIRRAVGPYAR